MLFLDWSKTAISEEIARIQEGRSIFETNSLNDPNCYRERWAQGTGKNSINTSPASANSSSGWSEARSMRDS